MKPARPDEEVAEHRRKALEHLEAALAITDLIGSGDSGYLIERA